MSIYLSLAETALPPKIISNNFFPQSSDGDKPNLMFAGTEERRHVERDDTAYGLLAEATEKLLKKSHIDKTDIGLLVTNVTLLDIPFNGVGGSWANELGIVPNAIYDMHNSGCTAFVFMAELAELVMEKKNLKYALLGNAQTSAGKLFAQEQNRGKPQSVVPGDGAGVALLKLEKGEGDGEILGFATKNHPEFSNDMYIERADGSKWWEPSEVMGIIEFPKSRIMRILSRGNRVVPERIAEVCENVGIKVTDIDYLITNQPNATFLRNWREFVQLPPERHFDSYRTYGNLFGAAMPINYAENLNNIEKGSLVCFAGFAHAGDYSGAMLVQF